MLLDKNLQVSTAQALSATARSTDVVDLKQDRDIGIGDSFFLVAVVTTALAGTSPTLAVSIQTDDNAAFLSPVTLATSATLTAAPLGTMIVVPLPRTNERYLAANFTLGGTTPTVTVDAYFTPTPPPGWQAYPGAIPG